MVSDTSLGPLTKPQVDALRNMNRSSHQLWSLIEDLLKFAEATTDQLSLDLVPTSLKKPLVAAVERAEPKAKSRDVSMCIDMESSLPVVRADADKIFWVVDQLLDNAIKFTPPQGQVSISTQTLPYTVKVSVADTGIGIPPERLPELFEPFHQLDGSLTRKVGGTGLGLSLAQTILSSHGSSIKVQSKVGAGSRFSFALPIL